MRDAGRRARRDPSEVALHSLRLRAKEMRFACELVEPVLGPEAVKVARACAKVQRRLGRYRDALSSALWLRDAARAAPEAAFLAGQLALAQREYAARLFKAWRDDVRQAKLAWSTFERNQLR